MAQQIKKKYLSSEVISYFDDQIDTVDVNLVQEIADRAAADSAEEAARLAADVLLQGEISSAISQEVMDRDAAIAAEAALRVSGDESSVLSANAYTDAQIVLAQGDISAAEAAIAQEIIDRAAADASLQLQIDNVLSNVDGTALDSLTEIVSAFQSADSSLNGAITTLSTGLSADIDAEESARIAADSALQGEIDAEEISRAAADATLQDNIDAEESARIAADSALDARVTTLESVVWFKEKFSISNGQTSITLSFAPKESSMSAFVDRLGIHEGAAEDFTISGAVMTLLNDLVSPGQSQIGNGDTVYVKYQK